MSVNVSLPSRPGLPVGTTAGPGHRCLVLVPFGFLPVTLIAAAAFGVAGLRELAIHLLLPVLALGVGVLVWRPDWTSSAVRALGAGIVATALYDVYRGSFLALGLMQVDPIPHIGVALHLEPAWLFGYLWRYLGNGGGMAIAFFALGFRGVRTGVLYGLFVCSGLLFVLVVAPYGQEMLFPLNGTTVVMAVGGHVIYGAALGWIAGRGAGGRTTG
jgi:hypothetical protein